MKKLALLISAVALQISCATSQKPANGIKTINATATIINTGSPLYDGCGYLFVVDSMRYHADNFKDDTTVVNKKVKLSATITGEVFKCGLSRQPNAGIPVIHITKMDK